MVGGSPEPSTTLDTTTEYEFGEPPFIFFYNNAITVYLHLGKR